MKPFTEQDITNVALEFSADLCAEIGKGNLGKTILRNRQYTKEGNIHVCASHEFCDANMVMDGAMKELGFDAELQDEKFQELWNRAWSLAKENEFYLKPPMIPISWTETHFEVVQAITMEALKHPPCQLIADRQQAQGHCGLYELAVELTNEFELANLDREWDGEFFDEVEAFMAEKFN